MSNTQPDSPLLSVKETAAYLRLSTATLSRLRKENARPQFVKLGNRVLYRKSELDDFIDSNVSVSN